MLAANRECDRPAEPCVVAKQRANTAQPIGGYMGWQFNKWWLLPFGILTTSALIASSIIIFGPTLADRSSDDEVALHGAHKPTEASGLIRETFRALLALAQHLACRIGQRPTTRLLHSPSHLCSSSHNLFARSTARSI